MINKMMFVLLSSFVTLSAFAEEGTATSSAGLKAIGAAIAIGLSVYGATNAQSKAAASALDGIARNPAAQNKIFTPMIIALALIESLVLLAFIIALVTIPSIK